MTEPGHRSGEAIAVAAQQRRPCATNLAVLRG